MKYSGLQSQLKAMPCVQHRATLSKVEGFIEDRLQHYYATDMLSRVHSKRHQLINLLIRQLLHSHSKFIYVLINFNHHQIHPLNSNVGINKSETSAIYKNNL